MCVCGGCCTPARHPALHGSPTQQHRHPCRPPSPLQPRLPALASARCPRQRAAHTRLQAHLRPNVRYDRAPSGLITHCPLLPISIPCGAGTFAIGRLYRPAFIASHAHPCSLNQPIASLPPCLVPLRPPAYRASAVPTCRITHSTVRTVSPLPLCTRSYPCPCPDLRRRPDIRTVPDPNPVTRSLDAVSTLSFGGCLVTFSYHFFAVVICSRPSDMPWFVSAYVGICLGTTLDCLLHLSTLSYNIRTEPQPSLLEPTPRTCICSGPPRTLSIRAPHLAVCPAPFLLPFCSQFSVSFLLDFRTLRCPCTCALFFARGRARLSRTIFAFSIPCLRACPYVAPDVVLFHRPVLLLLFSDSSGFHFA